MRIRRIRLQHVGPYRTPSEIDLDVIGPGLIVLSAKNGAGKTTLIESIPGCLYRYAPSRGPVANLATARDAQIEVVGEHDGEFVARLDMDNVSGKSEAVLLDGDGKAIVGPKVTSYDAAIRSRFPPLSVYLAAAFSCQTGEGTLLKMERADRRALFAKLLGLERFEILAACARKHADDVAKQMAATEAALEAVRGSLIDVVVLRSEVEGTRRDAGRWAEAVIEAQENLRKAAADEQRTTAEASEHGRLAAAAQKAQERYDEAASALVLLDVRVRSLEPLLREAPAIRAHAEAIRAAEAELAGLAAGVKAADDAAKRAGAAAAEARSRRTAAEAQVRELRAKLSALEAVLGDAPAIRAHAAMLSSSDAELERLRIEGEAAAKAEREAGEAAARAAATNGTAEVAFLDAERAVGDAAKAQDRAARAIESAEKSTSGVPCAGTLDDAARAGCPALSGHFRSIAEARMALKDIADGSKARLDERDAARTAADEASRSWIMAASVHREARDRAEHLRADYRRLRAEHDKLRAVDHSADLARAEAEAGVLRSGLEAAEKQLADAAATGDVLDNELVSVNYAAKDARALWDALADKMAMMRGLNRLPLLEQAESEAATLRGKLEAAQATAEAAEKDVATAKDAVPKFNADDLLCVEKVAALAKEALSIATDSAKEADRQVARLEAQLEQAEKSRVHAEVLMAKMQPMERDLAEWRFLGRALGREGVQALEMDAAGPRVAQLANDLLRSCWDGRFQVRFDTQTARAGGKGVKEDFAVTVLDSRWGRETDGSDLSGGEKVVVSSAIGRAIGWFHRETSGTSFDQVFVDEATGELDEEARPQYVQMMRRLLRAGGLSQVIFISHDPSLISMADAVVHVVDGTLRVMTPEEWRKQGAEA